MPRGTKSRQHVCTTCSKAYGKAEHLIRHERSHTGVRPFHCAKCGRDFSRIDSLSRHKKRHGHGEPSQNRNDSAETIDDHNEFTTISEQEVSYHRSRGLDPNISQTSCVAPVYHNDGPHSSTQPRMSVSTELVPGQDPGFDPTLLDDSMDPFSQFAWPDSEDLLQSILASNLAPWSENVEMLPSHHVLNAQQLPIQASSPWLTHDGEQTQEGHHAVRNVSQIISELSANVTSEAASTGLSKTFLNACLHMFFDQFAAGFPICHRPTFVFRNWTHPLLINSIALGSLFVGQEANVTKGDVLWKLAHTAVATSWHTLLSHQGPYDSYSGVQLILTALLGQTYAMLSGDPRLRLTAQVFHSLGFYWARKCGMYTNVSKFDKAAALSLSAVTEVKLEQWNVWAAEEVQLRALLGHYILDGLLTQFTGGPTCQRHASSPLRVPCSDNLFQAPNLEEWIEQLRLEQQSQPQNFRQLFAALFSTDNAPQLPPNLSPLTVKVLIEGLKSFVSEASGLTEPIIGNPSSLAVSQALGVIYDYIVTSEYSDGEITETLLRWHAVSIDAVSNSTGLCRTICSQLSVTEEVFGGSKEAEYATDLGQWTSSLEGRQALLHATAISDLFAKLPVGKSHSIFVPTSIFTSATIHCAFILGGISTISIPRDIDWAKLMSMDLKRNIDAGYPGAEGQVARYLQGSPTLGRSQARNLLYDSNMFLLRLRQQSQLWGVCGALESILQKWLVKCDS